MFSFLANPVYFYSLIGVLMVISILAIFSMGEEDKKSRKDREWKLQEVSLRIKKLEKTLEEKEELLKQSASVNEGLQKESAEIKEKLSKASNELSLSNEMYNGIKGQYGELEEKFSQLSEELFKLQSKAKGK